MKAFFFSFFLIKGKEKENTRNQFVKVNITKHSQSISINYQWTGIKTQINF